MAKAIKRQALGRGLSVLLKKPTPDNEQDELRKDRFKTGSVQEIPIEFIEPNPFQPRSKFDKNSLHELAISIKELGLIQPITLRKVDDNLFQLVAGERRFRASKMLGNKTITAYIRLANDQESLEMALVENIQRKDLDPIEIALSYKRLINEVKLTQSQMSHRVGKKRSTIANYLRLLKLDPIIQTGIRDGFIGMGHGRAIININSSKKQIEIYELIIEKKLSVRATENLIKKINKLKESYPVNKIKNPSFINDGIETILELFDKKIKVKMKGIDNGTILIPFNSKEDYKRIIRLLKGDL